MPPIILSMENPENTSKKLNFITEDSILIFLGIGCIGYSTFQTALGYESSTGNCTGAWFIAIFIGAGLAILNYKLRRNYQAGLFKKVGITLLLYLSIAAFSFIANFNAFYSEYMEETLLHKEVDNYQEKLDNLAQKVSSSYKTIDAISKAEDLIEKKTILLKKQILATDTPELGAKAKGIISEIELDLGINLDEPEKTTPERTWEFYRDQIKDILDKAKENQNLETGKFGKQLNNALGKAEFSLSSAKGTANLDDDWKAIKLAVQVYNTWGGLAEAYFQDKKIFSHKKESLDNYEIGKIGHSISSAKKTENREGAIFAICLSAFIDLLVPIMIFVLIPVSPQDPSTKRSRAKRKKLQQKRNRSKSDTPRFPNRNIKSKNPKISRKMSISPQSIALEDKID